MELVKDINNLCNSLASVRALGHGYISNFFLDNAKHSLWIQKDVLFSEKIYNTLFIIKQNEHFWNLYYASTDIKELKKSLYIFNSKYLDKTLILDLVGRKNDIEKLNDSLSEISWKEYTSLFRMAHIGTPEIEYDFNFHTEFCTLGEVHYIKELLEKFFDPLAEQIPTIEELQSFVSKNGILLCKINKEIAGFLVMESSVVSLYLRYWFVHPNYREQKVGSSLLRSFLNIGHDTKRQQLWVIKTNKNAIKRYEHYGFVAENLYDIILINKDIKYN